MPGGQRFCLRGLATLSKRWMTNISPLVMTGGTMLSGAVGLVLFSLLDPTGNNWGAIVQLDSVQWFALLFLSVVCSVIAYFAYNTALTRIAASKVAVYIYFEPVVAVLLGVTLLVNVSIGRSSLGREQLPGDSGGHVDETRE